MTGIRSQYRYSLVKVKYGTQAVGTKAQLYALSDGHVFIRKVKQFKQQYFLSYRKKTIEGEGHNDPPPPFSRNMVKIKFKTVEDDQRQYNVR